MTSKIIGKKTVSEISRTVQIDGQDTQFTMKLDVLPLDRVHGDYEISFKLNKSHFSEDDDAAHLTTDAVARMVLDARGVAERALEDYFAQTGQTRQLSLFSNSQPDPKRKRGRPASAKQSDLSDLDDEVDEQPQSSAA